MTYPFEKLTTDQRLALFARYWKVYINQLVDYHYQAGNKPVTFKEWWISQETITFNFYSA